MSDYTPEDEKAAREVLADIVGAYGLANARLVEKFARFHASARQQGREAGLEEAAQEAAKGAVTFRDYAKTAAYNAGVDEACSKQKAALLASLAAAIRALKSEPR